MNVIKFTYLTFGAALLFASCANDVVEPEFPRNDGRIYFRTSLPESASRAHIVSNDNLTKFNVTVFNPADVAGGKLDPFIDNVSVIKSGGSGVFSSDECLWPESGK